MRIVQARRWAAGAVMAALVAWGVHHHFLARTHVLRPGDRLVTLPLSSLSGSRAFLRPSGRAQVINVFATWCPPCREETPAFAAFASRLAQRGIEVVGIDQQENPAAVARFMQQFALPYMVLIDEGTITHNVLGARVIPTTIYVDATGVIRWERSGPMSTQDFESLSRLAASAG